VKRIRLNATINILAFSVLVASLFSGIIPWKVLPSGGGPQAGREAAHALFLGLARGEWRDIHVYASLALGGLVLLHLLLHWRWMLCIPKLFSRTKRQRHCSSEVVGAVEEDA